MIKTITQYDFWDAFNRSETYKNNFTHEGKKALFEYLENYEDETGEKIELDIVALCCDYTEYEDIEDVKGQYSNIKDIEDLRDNTQVIEFDGGIIIQNF